MKIRLDGGFGSVTALMTMIVMLSLAPQGSNGASVTVEANATVLGETAILVCDYTIDTEPLAHLTWSRLNDSSYVDIFFANATYSEVLDLIDSGSTGVFKNVSGSLSHELTIPSIQVDDETAYKCSVVDSTPTTTENTAALDVLVGCESNPCQNGGLCNDTSGSAVCDCDPNFSGSFCETKIDECSSDPCQNGATCQDGLNNYTCICLDCYTGYNCESQKVNECASDPCQNGATCLDECDQFVCQCPFNYKGTVCGGDCTNIESISQSQVIELGSPGTLTCGAATGTTAAYWSKSSTGSPRVHSSANYTITSVLEAHAGTYYCFVESADCTSRRTTTLGTTYEIYPNTTTRENVTLSSGDSEEFECSAEGSPTPTIQWYFTARPKVVDTDNGTVTEAPPSPVAIGNSSVSSFTLKLEDVDEDDEGTYACVATLAGDKDIMIKVISVKISDGSDGGLKDWEIALIVIAVIILVAIIVVVIVFFILKKKKSGGSAGRRSSTVEPSRARPTHRPQTDHEMRKSPAPYSYSEPEKRGVDSEYGYTPRALPVPPEGRGGKLPSLDVEEERERLQEKKKRKKKRQHIDEDFCEEDEEKNRYTE